MLSYSQWAAYLVWHSSSNMTYEVLARRSFQSLQLHRLFMSRRLLGELAYKGATVSIPRPSHVHYYNPIDHHCSFDLSLSSRPPLCHYLRFVVLSHFIVMEYIICFISFRYTGDCALLSILVDTDFGQYGRIVVNRMPKVFRK